jgi:phosphoenolpyruvate carboxykinase (ATP)
VFNLSIPKSCGNVPSEVLNPKNTWQDKNDFDATLKLLGGKFAKNFEKYSK